MASPVLSAFSAQRCPLVKICKKTLARTLTYATSTFPPDFEFHERFFSPSDQRTLLAASLRKLDATETRQWRKRRKEFTEKSGLDPMLSDANDIQTSFLPDELYDFQPGHYDGVITRYREMHVSSWLDEPSGLSQLLERLRRVHPDQPTHMHILHLASDGEIFPHIDNIEASGSWILGVSLGASRIMRLESADGEGKSYEIPLPSGSVYIQRNSLRYGYKHSVLKKGATHGMNYDGGQRLSIMVRDRLPEQRVPL